MTNRLILANSNVFDVVTGNFNTNIDILIEEGIIKKVGTLNRSEKENTTIIECSGRYVLPGLFECHAHLCFLTLLDTQTKERNLSQFIESGITQVRDLGGPINVLKEMHRSIVAGEVLGPEIYYAGPMHEKSPITWEKYNEKLPGFTVKLDTKEEAKKRIKELSEGGATLVKTFNNLDFEVLKSLLEELKTTDFRLTHDPGPPFLQSISLDRGIDLGITCFEHVHNMWSSVLTNELEKEHGDLLKKELTQDQRREFFRKVAQLGIDSIDSDKLDTIIGKLVQNHVFYCPTLTVFETSGNEYAEQMGFEIKPEGVEQSKQIATLLKPVLDFFVQKMSEKKVKLLVGHDGCNPEFTFREMEALKAAGVSEEEIIKGATIYPAEWFGLTGVLGSISEKRKANILVVNENPLKDITALRTPSFVIKEGDIVFKKK
ncbi:MAG: amidohydrolase family protein [Candidatus Hodarchaeales archaeon]|jgi:hypothetical protein